MEFFVPGRTEIIGNHTDHQLGRVIAAPVNLGVRAACEKTGGGSVELESEGFGTIRVALDALEPVPEERGTAAALVRGMACAMAERGYALGGFAGRVSSALRPGGGLSSSAAFTVLVGKVISSLFNGGGADARTLAECAREAENRHFGKPSGLMDQLACAVGRTVYIDFLTGETETLDCSFAGMGLALCLTDTGGSHAGLTADYAAITGDMLSVAREFGVEKLCYVNCSDFLARRCPRDRAHLRAEHFFEENLRVPRMRDAIRDRDGAACLALMNESGRSSEEKLANILPSTGDDRLARGLALSRELLEHRGAWRVHGGGFAGCVQALVPESGLEEYRAAMDGAFGAGSCMRIM